MSINLGGTEITVRVSSAAPDAEPVWVDISDYVIVPAGATLDTWLGRSTELPGIDPAKGKLTLLDNDDRFTIGNVSSPYYPWWKQSRRFQLIETVGDKKYVLGDLFLEIPQTIIQTQPVEGDVKQITVAVSGVDVLARLANSGKFLSNLAEHILYHGGTTLRAYWPLNEAAAPANTARTAAWALRTNTLRQTGFVANDPLFASISYNSGPSAPGDDINAAVFQASRDTTTSTVVESRELTGVRSSNVTLSAGQVMTVVGWIRADSQMSAANQAVPFWLRYADANGDVITGGLSAAVGIQTGAVLYAVGNSGADWSGTVTGVAVPTEIVYPVAVRLGFDPAVIELWAGSNVYTSTMTVTSAVAAPANYMEVGRFFDGSVAHLQVYIGAQGDWDHDDFLAQRDAGLNGLERQTTGERIQTVLDYAGFPSYRRDIDLGASVMSQASLAGKRPGQALDEANDTERGRLFALAGRIQFHDRIRVYNV